MASEIDSFLTKKISVNITCLSFCDDSPEKTIILPEKPLFKCVCESSVLDLWCIMMDLLESISTTPWHWSHNFLLNTFIHNAVKYLLYWAQNSDW